MIFYLLILQVVMFVVLLLVLRKLFYKQLDTALQRLQSLHAENLSRGQQLTLQAEAAKLEWAEMLQKAHEEADNILKEAKLAAEKITADVERQAGEQTIRIVERSQAELDRKARDFLVSQHQQSVELAVRIVKLAFSPKSQEILQDHLLDELVAGIESLDKEMFPGSSQGQVQVVTAFLLSEGRRASIMALLCEKQGVPVEVDFKNDPQIIAGLVIRIGALTLDGSLRNKIEKAAQHLKK